MERIEFLDAGIAQVATIRADGTRHRYTLAPGADLSDQPPGVRQACEAAWTPGKVRAYDAHLRATVPPAPTRAQTFAAATALIARLHADFLREATGDATPEERDTWRTKEEAARACLSGTATEGQRAMIEREAGGDGTDPDALARTIVAKADACRRLVGIAGAIRAGAKAEIARIARDSLSGADPSAALDAATRAAAARFAEARAGDP